MSLSIGIFSDVVCPWCYVGKRRLERALDAVGLRATTRIEWLPFELNPDMPADGMPRAEYRMRKFGAGKSGELDRRMTEIGQEEGIPFALGRIERTPNTRAAHAALQHAATLDRADDLKEALLRAYFVEGRDVGDPDILVAVGQDVGLESSPLRQALSDPRLLSRVAALERKAAEIGVSGVPFFIVDGAWAVSGAQSSNEWVAALTARESRPDRSPA